MKKRTKFLLALIGLAIVYIGFLYMNNYINQNGEVPQLTVPDSVLKVSVKDGDKVLLQDVKASDKEDGDLSSDVFIESLSEFNDVKRRTVTYAVFDSDDHLVRATRQIEYTDYESPVIDVRKALCYYYLNTYEQYKDYVSAHSVVDGDITSHITLENDFYEDNIHYIEYSVKDSCGVKSNLKLKADELNEMPAIEIYLNKYLVRVKKGTTINPDDYVDEIVSMGMTDNSLKDLIEVQDNYNPDKSGMYEFIYRLTRNNGDYGITKLVVIVE